MKNILIAGAAAILLVTGCTNKEQENQILSLNQERDSILTSSFEKDQSIDEFIDAFEAIEGNLTMISEKQKNITRQTEENRQRPVSRLFARDQKHSRRELASESGTTRCFGRGGYHRPYG